MRAALCLLLVCLAFVGCAAGPNLSPFTPGTVPELTPDLSAALSHPRRCDPAPAKFELSRTFKYGCFCGEKWPAIEIPVGAPSKGMPPEQMEKLIAEYYGIEPIDDIDAACQAHDVCWLKSGFPWRKCNTQFIEMLAFIRIEFEQAIIRQGGDPKAYGQCAALAEDMRAATTFFMREETEPGSSSMVLNAILSPAAGAVLIGSIAQKLLTDAYPGAKDICKLPTKGS